MPNDARGQTLTCKQNLRTETCYSCGVLFAMAEDFYQARLADKAMFYCPAGHGQHYTGKTEAQKLKEQLDEERRQRQSAEQRIAMWQDEYDQENKRAEKANRRAAAYKGHATRITKRAKAGVCPCCNRTFKQLAAHMASQHPQFTPLEINESAPEGTRIQ